VCAEVLPPVMFVFASGCLVLSLNPIFSIERIGLATTALLTEVPSWLRRALGSSSCAPLTSWRAFWFAQVFLQLGFNDKLPDVGSVTVNDWLFDWVYLTLLVVVAECILVAVIMERFHVRLMKASVDFDEAKTERQGTVLLMKRRRVALVLDWVVGVYCLLAYTVGVTVVIILAVYA